MISKTDIHWLAGYLDGEACFLMNRGQPRITVGAIDSDLIYKCQRLIGGPVWGPKIYAGKQPEWRWCITGSRAIGTMMTLFSLMSQRRQWQIAKVWKEWKERPAHAKFRKTCAKGHPFDKVYSYTNRLGQRKSSRVCSICHRDAGRRSETKSARSTAK